MLLPLVLAMVIGSPLAGRALDRRVRAWCCLRGTCCWSGGCLSGAFLPRTSRCFYAGSVFVGLALGILLGAPLRYIMLGEAAARERASAQGALTLFTNTGQLVGGALVGAVIASHGGGAAGYENAYLLGGALAVALTLLTLGLKRQAEERGQVMAAAWAVG